MLAQHPLLPHFHFSRMSETHPSLLLHSDCPIQNHLYSLHSSSSSNGATNIQTLTRIRLPRSIEPQFVIAGSCNGLLCSWNSLYQDQCFIFNPFTTDCLQLPKPKQFHSQHRIALGFGFHSPKEYKVVRIVYYHTNQVEDGNIQMRKPLPESEVEVLTLGDGDLTWRNKGNSPFQVQGRPSNVMVEEKLHWLSCKYRNNFVRRIISFDLADEQFRQVPSPRLGMFGRHCTELVSLRGCLSAVVHGFMCLYIWVMKEYGVQDSWIKEFTISDSTSSLRVLSSSNSNSIGGHGPKVNMSFNPCANESMNSPCCPLNWSQVRVLWLFQNGEILLQHRGRCFVAFDPNSGMLREFLIPGLPQDFNAFVHMGSLNWLDTNHIQ